jgi:hypothetical protein
MFERFRRTPRNDRGGSVAVHDRDAPPADDTARDDTRFGRETTTGSTATRERPVREDPGTPGRGPHGGPIVAGETMAAMRARQRDRFGGINWGAAFFGFLTAVGLASILLSIAAAAGFALGFSTNDVSGGNADTIGLGGGIALLVILAIAWYCGGYVAGRMSRFDGFRQGLAVWMWTLLFIVVVAVLGAIGGSEYNVFNQLNLPNIPVSGDTLTKGGAIAGVAALVVMLLFAIFGGKAGERYHRRIDRLATREYRPS